MNTVNPISGWKRCLRFLAFALAWLLIACLTLWATAALYFDLSWPPLRPLTPVLYLVAIVAIVYRTKRNVLKLVVCLAGFLLVLTCWLSLLPSNDRNWELDDSQTPWAEINGEQVTIHNFRVCSYRSELDYNCKWLTKSVSLTDLRGIDLFITYWGSPWIAHPILAFQFGENDYVAASIEARYEVGQSYSAIRGFFRQYSLLYIFADERDVVRLRTNYRTGEDVYLFHTVATPYRARLLFLQYLNRANFLRDHPVWYNAATDNCTTNIFDQMAATGLNSPANWAHDWWILLNGRLPEMLYHHGNIAGDLPFPELLQRAHINPVARTLNDAPDFSRRIRLHRPGFEFLENNEGMAP